MYIYIKCVKHGSSTLWYHFSKNASRSGAFSMGRFDSPKSTNIDTSSTGK